MSIKLLWRANTRTTHPVDAATRCPETLASWLRRFPDSKAANRDFEDWGESAAIGLALDAHADITEVLPDNTIKGFVSGTSMGGMSADPDAPTGFMFGCWSKFDGFSFPVAIDPVGCDRPTVDHVVNWTDSEVAIEAADRQIFVTSAVDYGDHSTEPALEAIIAAGGTHVFVKSTHKLFAEVHEIRGVQGKRSSATFRDSDWMDHMQIHCEDRPGTLILQGVMKPTHEYRMIVVDDEIVTGAGCIEPFVPFMNTARFDPRTEEVRNQSGVGTETGIVERYVAFARGFATAFAAEARTATGRPPVYCLDLCIDATDGKVRMIELNPATGFGLYASDAQAYVDAIVAFTTRESARLATADRSADVKEDLSDWKD